MRRLCVKYATALSRIHRIRSDVKDFGHESLHDVFKHSRMNRERELRPKELISYTWGKENQITDTPKSEYTKHFIRRFD